MASSNIPLFEIFMAQAERLKISEDKIQEYITECFDRHERDREREERRLERESQKEREEHEKAIKEHEKNIKEQDFNIAEIQLQTLRLKAETNIDDRNIDRDNENDHTGPNTANMWGRPQAPKLPKFNEKVDEMDAWLYRFEKHAKAMRWPEDHWTIYLASLLEGKALNLYRSLTADEDIDYETLAENLLIKYHCTADGFRAKFRSFKPNIDEPMTAYAIELKRLLSRWVQLSKTDYTKEGLLNLILKEQFLQSISPELATFIKERDIDDFDTMIQTAEVYRLAHPKMKISKNPDIFSGASAAAAQTGHQPSGFGRGQNFSNRAGSRRGGISRGHYGNQNFQNGQNFGNQRGHNHRGNNHSGRGGQNFRGHNQGQRGGQSGTPAQGQGQNRVCELCVKPGHKPSDCWMRNTKNSCFICGIGGHYKDTCPLRGLGAKLENTGSCDIDNEIVCSLSDSHRGSLSLELGQINDIDCSVLRDTGATICGVRKRLVQPHQIIPGIVTCKTFGGEIHKYPQANVPVQSQYFTGNLICCVLDDPVADLIIGNIPGVVNQNIQNPAGAVSTRAQSKRENIPKKPLSEIPEDLNVNKEKLIELQKSDPSLKTCFQHAETEEPLQNGTVRFYINNSILYREFSKDLSTKHQIVVPKELRSSVLTIAHDQILSGHCGRRRTLLRILSKFFWPKVSLDVKNYLKTCDICQKTTPKGRIHPVPLAPMPLISKPFERIAIDLVGPISPPSEENHTYILTCIDLATRFPEAIALKSITSIDIAEALMTVFARLGFPNQILSDNGSQFNSDLTKQFHALCGIKGITTSVYHPQANGCVERFHSTLKAMLKKVIQGHPRCWHRYIPALLFAYRELPNESTGFSPFELMLGRQPRGPIALLASTWTDETATDKNQDKHIYSYVFELKNILAESNEIAAENSQASSKRSKHYFDKKARQRKFKKGDEVLILLPTSSNKLIMTWKGPFKIMECFHPDYKINIHGKIKVYHANMLKEYHRREVQSNPSNSVTTSIGETVPWNDITELYNSQETNFSNKKEQIQKIVRKDFPEDRKRNVELDLAASVGIIQEENDHLEVPTIPSTQSESIDDIDFDENLSDSEKAKLREIFEKRKKTLSPMPGNYPNSLMMRIILTTDAPVRKKPYDLPYQSRQIVEKEIAELLELGIIEKSNSAYSSPLLLVKKKDGTFRPCIDYRDLNKITVFDAEPIPDVEELYARIACSTWFTRIDLSKGYWQILIDPRDRHKTAFATHLGLFQWTRVPFGLASAPAIFARMMRELALEEASSLNFFDDILTHNVSFNDHIAAVERVLKKLEEKNLTAKPSKIKAGYKSLEFLGHVVGHGTLRPEEEKVKKILNMPTPKTKKQVRSLLGLIGFYRRYVQDFASITAPLSDLTKDNAKRGITWTPECEKALQQIKEVFSSSPILQLPRLNEPFLLRSDASAIGIGAVLLQEKENVLHPVCFASRKLLDRERNYSTIERECLGIVWGISKFSKYLWGTTFTLETDHRPLTYLRTSKFKNSRIMRWALALQEYSFNVGTIPGPKNLFADLLSRSETDQDIP